MIHNTYLLDINIHHLQLSNECHGILSIGIGTLANVNISIDRNSSSYGIVVNFNYPNDLLVNGKPILDSVDVRFIDINNSELNCRGSEKNFPLLDDWNEVGKLVPLITSIPNLNPIGYLRPVIHLIRNKHLIVGQIQVVAQLYEYTTSTVEDVYCLADEKKPFDLQIDLLSVGDTSEELTPQLVVPKDPSEVIDEESIFSILEDIQRMREEKQQQVQVEVPKECQKMPPKPTPKKRVMKEKVPKQYTKKTQTKVVKFVPAPTHNPFIQPGTVRRK